MNNFNNRNAINKRLPSLNLVINPLKWYNLQKDMIHMIFSCDSNREKAFNDINKVDSINFQRRNKIEKLKLFFNKRSLKALNVFRQFLTRAFQLRK